MADNKIEFLIEAKDKFSSTFHSLGSSVSSLKTLVAGLATGALVRATTHALEFASSIQETADRIDISTNALQEWRVVAQLSGASAEKMDAAFGMFSRTMGAAAAGSGEAQRAFQRVGISLNDLNTQAPEQIFERTRDAISGMGSAAQRNQLLMQLFGRQGRDLGNVFAESSIEVARMRQEAQRLGAVLSEQTIAKAKEAKDKLDLFNQVVKVQMTGALVEVVPFLTQISGLIAKLAPSAKYAAVFVNGLAQGFEQLGTRIGGYASALAQMGQFNFKGARETIKQVHEDIIAMQKRGEEARKSILEGNVPKARKSILEDNVPNQRQKIDPNYLRELQKQYDTARGMKLAQLSAERDAQLEKLKQMNLDVAGEAQARQLIEDTYARSRFQLQMEEAEKLKGLGEQYSQVKEQRLAEELVQLRALKLAEVEIERYAAQQKLQIEADRIRDSQAQRMADLENQILTNQTITDQEAQIMRNAEQFKMMSEARKMEATKKAGLQALNDFGTMNEKMFKIAKAAGIADAIINTYRGVAQALAHYPPPYSFVFAAMQLAAGMKQVNAIRSQQYTGQAHAGMTDVPSEGTFLLNKGERVLAPQQNQDLTNFLEAGGRGGVNVAALNIYIDVPDSRALIEMDRNDWRDIVARSVIPALDALDRMGVRPLALERQRGI